MDKDFEKRIEEAKLIVNQEKSLRPCKALNKILRVICELEEKVKALENPLQPIETAPKDGTWILGHNDNLKQYHVMASSFDGRKSRWNTVVMSSGCSAYSMPIFKEEDQPTHWTYLPKLEGV